MDNNNRPPRIGDVIRITKDIEWDGQDCHPPATIACEGDVMYVKRLRGYDVMASHSFMESQTILVQQGEYEFCQT